MELDAKHAFYWCVHEQARSFHPNGSQSVKGERIHQRAKGVDLINLQLSTEFLKSETIRAQN